MAKTSQATAPVKLDIPIVEERAAELADITVSFVTIREDHDLAPMLAGLPDGRCQCPHWGVMTTGRLTVTYADRVEVYEAGDAFYMTPGHTPAAIAGTELVQFSPTDELAATEAAMAAAMRATTD